MFDWEENGSQTSTAGTATATADDNVAGGDFDRQTSNQLMSHPELMSKQQLIDLLRKRHLDLPEELSDNGYEYSNLIDLYNKLILPLPQRQYNDNRRQSRQLKAKQLHCNQSNALKRQLVNDTNDDHNNNAKKMKTINTNHNNIDMKRNAANVSSPQTNDHKRHKISYP